MKIDLNTRINADSTGNSKVRLGDIIENALFRSQLENARDIYNKIHGKKEAELSVKELSSIQEAIEPLYIAGINNGGSIVLNADIGTNILITGTSGNHLDISTIRLIVTRANNTVINSMSGLLNGTVLFNTTTNRLMYYNGSEWRVVSSSSF